MSYSLKWMCCLGFTLCSHDQEGSASKCIEVVGRIHFLFAIEFIVGCFFKVNNRNQRKRGGKKHRKETMGGDWYFTIGNKLQVLLANGTGYDSLWGHLSYVHHKWPVCFEYRWRKQLLFRGINAVRLKIKRWNGMYLNLFLKDILAPEIFVFIFFKKNMCPITHPPWMFVFCWLGKILLFFDPLISWPFASFHFADPLWFFTYHI